MSPRSPLIYKTSDCTLGGKDGEAEGFKGDKAIRRGYRVRFVLAVSVNLRCGARNKGGDFARAAVDFDEGRLPARLHLLGVEGDQVALDGGVGGEN